MVGTNASQESSTQRLASMSIFPLFMQTAIPICIGMLVIGLYNLVDGIFIARWVGTEAIGAVSMVFPMQMLIASVGAMVSSGSAAILTRLIGERKVSKAGEIAGNAILLAVFFSLVFFVIGWWYLDAVLEFLAVSPVFYEQAYQYAQPIILVAITALLLPVFGDIYRAEGKAKILMLLMLTSSVMNIVLDYIFIVVMNWGVSGAAWATVFAQVVSLIIAIWMYLKGKTLVRFSFQFNLRLWGTIAALGVPVLVAQMGMAIQTGLVNFQFATLATESWISAYGILGRLSIFIILPMIAMLIAFQTICGFNLGSKALDRVQGSIKVVLTTMVLYSSIITLLLVTFPEALLGIFTADPELISYGKIIIFSTIWGLPLAGINMLATGYYQAKGDAKLATFFSLFRVVLIMSPLMFILPYFFSLEGVFFSIVASDVLSASITLALCWREYKKLSTPNLKYANV